jgi:hypothetical protein
VVAVDVVVTADAAPQTAWLLGKKTFRYNLRMNKMLKRRVLQLWIAILATLFSALAPAISQAYTQTERYPGLGEMCSVKGLSSPKQAPAKPDPLGHHMKNCPYCATHGGSFALLPAAPLSVQVLDGHDLYPPLYYRAPAPLFNWAAAQPRGPPAVS